MSESKSKKKCKALGKTEQNCPAKKNDQSSLPSSKDESRLVTVVREQRNAYQATEGDKTLSLDGPKVWDCHAGRQYPEDAIYVGCRVRNRKGEVIREGTIFGNAKNPLVSHHGWLKTEEEFRKYAKQKLLDPAFQQQAEQLRGRHILCWCVQDGPKRAKFCHARVWLDLANRKAHKKVAYGQEPQAAIGPKEQLVQIPLLLHAKGAPATKSIGGVMPSNQDFNDTANQVLTQLDNAWCVKLSDLKPQLLELRAGFKKLKGKERIADCKTWDEFCTKKLRRTKRAVNMLLAEPKPKREETFHPEAKERQRLGVEDSAETDDSFDAEREEDFEALEPSSVETVPHCESKPNKPLSADDAAAIAKGEAIARAIRYLDHFDGQQCRIKLAEFYRELKSEMWDKIEPVAAKKPAASAWHPEPEQEQEAI